jgi:hypothetical protein
MSPARAYIDYGGLATSAAPFSCTDSVLDCFFLEADHGRLGALCRRVFDAPTRNAVAVEPVAAHVMLCFGVIPHIRPQGGPASRMGSVPEKQVSIFVPVLVHDRRVRPARTQLAFFVPFIWVDNAISLAGGREIYGYPKNFGRISVPVPGQPRSFTLDAFGGNFGAHNQAGWRPLIELDATTEETDEQSAAAADWQSLEHALSALQTSVRRQADHLLAPGIDLAGTFEHMISTQCVPQVFLKQFRSARDGAFASFQQVVDAPIHITRLSGGMVAGSHTLVLHHLDSHPVGEELGLQDQSTERAFRLDMDFVLDTGSVLWDAHQRTQPQALPPGEMEWVAGAMRALLAVRPGIDTLLHPRRAVAGAMEAIARILLPPAPQPRTPTQAQPGPTPLVETVPVEPEGEVTGKPVPLKRPARPATTRPPVAARRRPK